MYPQQQRKRKLDKRFSNIAQVMTGEKPTAHDYKRSSHPTNSIIRVRNQPKTNNVAAEHDQAIPHTGGARVRWNRRPPTQSEVFHAMPQKKVDRKLRQYVHDRDNGLV